MRTVSIFITPESRHFISGSVSWSAALPSVHAVVRVLMVLNWLMVGVILALLFLVPTEGWILSSLDLSPSPAAARVVAGLRTITVLGIVSIPLNDELLHERRMTLTELADRIGLPLPNPSILKTGKARAIRFSTLMAICEALACQPGDILKFEQEGAARGEVADAGERRA